MKSMVALGTGASPSIGEASAEKRAKVGYKVCSPSRRRAQAGTRSLEMLGLDVTSDASIGSAVRSDAFGWPHRIGCLGRKQMSSKLHATIVTMAAAMLSLSIMAGCKKAVEPAPAADGALTAGGESSCHADACGAAHHAKKEDSSWEDGSMNALEGPKIHWKNVQTRTVTAGDVEFAYRELGSDNPGTPVVFLVHLAAVMDNWDPRIVDGFATKHRVVVFDNRGIGASSGSPATSIEQMAEDAVAFIRALGFVQVDLFGFSMGGMIAQEIVLKEPPLVRKMILAGTGPAGGEGISSVARVTYLDMLRGYLTFQDPKQFLFFTRTSSGIRAGKEFLARLKERSENRDKKITLAALRAQLKALGKWGSKEPADLSKVQQHVLVANGDSDRMVPSKNTYDLARRLPNSQLIIYPDSGHGGVFQYHADFVPKALEFLAREQEPAP